jgi:hypothetical protein
MAKTPSEPAEPPSTPESLADVNERAAAAGSAATTAEARGGSASGGMVDVTTADVPPA